MLHLSMLMRHLEKQLEESRSEVETLRRRLEVVGDERQRYSRDKSAVLDTIGRQVSQLFSQHSRDKSAVLDTICRQVCS